MSQMVSGNPSPALLYPASNITHLSYVQRETHSLESQAGLGADPGMLWSKP